MLMVEYKPFMLIVIMLNVIVLSVVMLSVVAPQVTIELTIRLPVPKNDFKKFLIRLPENNLRVRIHKTNSF